MANGHCVHLNKKVKIMRVRRRKVSCALNCRTVSIGNFFQSWAGKLSVLFEFRSRKIEVVSFPSIMKCIQCIIQSAKTRISNLLESRFSESTERIEAKSISFERYFKAQDSYNIWFAFATTFSPKNGSNLCLFNTGSAV